MSNGPNRANAVGIGGSGLRRGRSTSNGLNILVSIDSYHNVDDRAEENRYVVASLLHDVPEWGMKAEFDPMGMPLTKVQINMPPNGSTERRGIRELTRPVGGGMPIDVGGIVAFEKCNFTPAMQNQRPHISAGFSRGLATSEELALGRKIPMLETMTAVLPEGVKRQRQGGAAPSRNQTVVSLLPSHAIRISSPNDLGNCLNNLIQNDIGRPGHPGVAIIANRVLPSDPSQAAKMASDPQTRYGKLMCVYPENVAPQGAQPDYQLPSVQSVMNKLAADSGLFAAVGNPEWDVVVVPVVHNRLAKSLVLSNQDGRNKRDLSDPYSLYCKAHADNIREGSEYYLGPDNVPVTKKETGFARTHSMVTYMSTDPNERGPAMRTYARPMRNTGLGYATPDVVSIHDIETPFTHEAHRTAIKAIMEQSFETGRTFTQMRTKARKAQSPQQNYGQAPDQRGHQGGWGAPPSNGAGQHQGGQPYRGGGQPQYGNQQGPSTQQGGWGAPPPNGAGQHQGGQPYHGGGQPPHVNPQGHGMQQGGWDMQPSSRGGSQHPGNHPGQYGGTAPQGSGFSHDPSTQQGGWETSDPGWEAGSPVF